VSIALTLGRVRPSNIRRLPLFYGLICPPSAVLTAAAFWPVWQNRPLPARGNDVQSLASLAAGIRGFPGAGHADVVETLLVAR
jgi:hypothetical protein